MTVPRPCKQCGKLAYEGDLIIVSAKEYRKLVDQAKATASATNSRQARAALARSKIFANLAVRDFIRERENGMTLLELTEACRLEFGADAPSRSAIHRFLSGSKGS